MSGFVLSKRAQETPPSPIRKLAGKARVAKAAGRQVFQLNIGQPDIETPDEFFAGLKLYQDRVVAYEASEGNQALRDAWSRYMQVSINLAVPPEQIMITTGASEALVFLFMILCDPGDEVIIFDPTYANYLGFAAISGVNLISIPTQLGENFALPERSRIQSRISPRTRAILLCSPNNPTGTVYSREELQMLLDICSERGLFLIADETYREFVFDGAEALSVLHLSPNDPTVIVVDSLSKRFSLCGARLGCVFTANQEVLRYVLNLSQARLASPSIDQFAAAHMLNNISPNYVERIRTEYQLRRDTVFNELAAVKDVRCVKPKGAFYTVIELPVENAEHFAEYMLTDFSHNNQTVFLAPANGFYTAYHLGLNQVRLAYVLNPNDLKTAVKVLGAGLEAYKKRNG